MPSEFSREDDAGNEASSHADNDRTVVGQDSYSVLETDRL